MNLSYLVFLAYFQFQFSRLSQCSKNCDRNCKMRLPILPRDDGACLRSSTPTLYHRCRPSLGSHKVTSTTHPPAKQLLPTRVQRTESKLAKSLCRSTIRAPPTECAIACYSCITIGIDKESAYAFGAL